MTAVYTLGSVLAVSLLSLVGLFLLAGGEERARRMSPTLISFAAGALLGDTFLHLIPEIFAGGGLARGLSAQILAGVAVFLVLERFLRHGHFHLSHHGHGHLSTLAISNLVADGLHNLIDGVLIAASYLVSPAIGLSTTIAVLLHEIPQEIGDFGILVHSGLTVRRALLFNLLSATMSLVGAIATLALGHVVGDLARAMLPVTAGAFLYLALAALLPELRRPTSVGEGAREILAFALGIGLMALLLLLD